MQAAEKERSDLVYHISQYIVHLRPCSSVCSTSRAVNGVDGAAVKGAVLRQQSEITDAARKPNPHGKFPTQDNGI
jgi:hypothetical protein